MKSSPLIIVAILAGLIGLLYGVSSFVGDRPLDVDVKAMGDRERDIHYAKVMRFSQPAIGGMIRFGDHCAACHGRHAEGTVEGPSLLDRAYSIDFRYRELFHTEVARSIPAHEAIIEGGKKDGLLDFNSVEMMGKFLREIRRKGPPPPVEG